MRMTRDEDRNIRKFRSQRRDAVREIIAAGAWFQTHVTCEHNRICPFTLCSCYRATNGFDRLLKIDSPRKFARKPKRHPRRRDPNDRKLNPREFLQDEWVDFCERMFRIGKLARRLSLQYRIRSQHWHRRSLQSLVKRFDPPIEFVIANDPGVVTKMIKQINHQFSLVSQT